jgi:4-hydroxy-2-oxoheptanedioate aldolase
MSRMTIDTITSESSERLRRLWRQDRPAFGLWSSLADGPTAELLADTSFDYVCVDLQHGLATFSELPSMIQAMRGAGRAPVVRVPWNEPAAIMRALDVGASAVVVPLVNSADDARRAAAACRYPPDGERSWGPMWADVRAGGVLPPEQQNAAAMCLVMVETQAGVDALEEIVAVPGVDGVYIGPNDLALGCGYGRDTYRESGDVEKLLQQVADTCRAAGIVCGLHCSDTEMAAHWARRGMQMLTVGQDVHLLRAAAAAAWASLEDAVGAAGGARGSQADR